MDHRYNISISNILVINIPVTKFIVEIMSSHYVHESTVIIPASLELNFVEKNQTKMDSVWVISIPYYILGNVYSRRRVISDKTYQVYIIILVIELVLKTIPPFQSQK